MTHALILLAALGSTENLSIFDPASPSAEQIRSLSLLVSGIATLIFIVVEGVLFVAIARFRGQPAPGAVEPPQVYGSKAIEIAWTAAQGANRIRHRPGGDPHAVGGRGAKARA